ncbi:MAG: hypothetical protein JWO81_1163, partial [Alphaproteobacteria bacterium]|nr:hypothetical protein [Alphaproteobacteria bacterium]
MTRLHRLIALGFLALAAPAFGQVQPAPAAPPA